MKLGTGCLTGPRKATPAQMLRAAIERVLFVSTCTSLPVDSAMPRDAKDSAGSNFRPGPSKAAD